MFLASAIIAIGALLVASWTDLKTREVPDWLSYSLIIIGVTNGILASLIFHTWSFIAYSVAGLLIFIAIAYLMFYAGQWGGGDSKLIMGIGALAGFEFSASAPFIRAESFLIAFWINTLLVGVVYAMLWSFVLAIKNIKSVKKRFYEEVKRATLMRNTVFAATIVVLLLSFFPSDKGMRVAIYIFAVAGFATFYLLTFVKAVEKACMYKLRAPEEITEGDWIAKEVRVDGKYLCGPKDLGIEKNQIEELMRLKRKGKITKVLIKEGIPFVPSFLISFLVTLQFGNVLFLML
jgi:Flp pilus assembly protein protease CpaA